MSLSPQPVLVEAQRPGVEEKLWVWTGRRLWPAQGIAGHPESPDIICRLGSLCTHLPFLQQTTAARRPLCPPFMGMMCLYLFVIFISIWGKRNSSQMRSLHQASKSNRNPARATVRFPMSMSQPAAMPQRRPREQRGTHGQVPRELLCPRSGYVLCGPGRLLP